MNRLVLWDFDGTLVSRPGKWGFALMAALDEQLPGHSIPPEALRGRLRTGFPWHEPQLPHPELSTPEKWWGTICEVIVRAYVGAGLREETAREVVPTVRRLMTDPTTYQLFDDTIPALEKLARAGWRHVILSNHVPELPRLVAGVGLDRYVDDVVGSAETGYEKPHPQSFRIGVKRAGSPEQVWMVGDSPEADVQGAEAVGIPAILVRAEDPNVSRQAKGLLEAAHIILDSR